MLRACFLATAVVAFASSIGGASSDGFHTGDAQASADTFSLNLKAANATIGFTYGRSLAGYQDRTGTSEARALDLGVLPVLFAGEQCDGTPGLLNADTLPKLTRADSSEEGAAASRRLQAFQPGIGGAPAGPSAGFQDATATPLPSSWAGTESAPADIGLIAIDGGRTEVTTQLKDQVREAHAVSTAEQLRVLGGLFTFNKPRWEATAQSGARSSATGSFSFASATVLGIPRSPADALADLEGFKAGLEQLLAPLGVVLDLPKVEVRDDGVKVTPMGFRIVDPPFGSQVVLPFLGQIDTQVAQWREDLLARDCKNATVLTVVDVLLGVLGGSGSVEALAGGVDVSTHDTDYSIPPIETLPESAAVTDTLPLTDLGVDDLSSGYSDLGAGDLDASYDTGAPLDLSTDLGSVPVTPSVAGAREEAVLPTASLGGMEEGTAGKAGVAVGTIALLGALGLSLGDRLVGRRARRMIP
ncbi:choice-of-anchor P family protein [Dermatobacter hominis]|uniref:choice-of-anchor P family protein n=1 Tax=Dermatobacter hominis TaxID=2884263 RepID=UPI001D113439|nr:choice-of-anchor P family protein [Dermatobacter hominis]UDY37851.1 hypothetical protein LH044_09975 [Dermatobacter hominis]